ncbi:MAG TPA: cupin domain-containing protein [Vicinamibacterales bacterium]
MTLPRAGSLLCIVSLLASSPLAIAQNDQAKRRLAPKEIEALPSESAGAGTSGLPAVTTRVLFGDPTKPGLYTIELRVAPNTVIQAHTHRDMRTAVVVSGLWYFGYGSKNEQTLVKALPPGAFYTEPASESHFARTGPEGATVSITGYGPTDTVYVR